MRAIRCSTPMRWRSLARLRHHRVGPPDARAEGVFRDGAGRLGAFLRCAVDIRNIDVAAASKKGMLVTHATPGFIASVSEQTIGFMIDIARNVSEYATNYRRGTPRRARDGS